MSHFPGTQTQSLEKVTTLDNSTLTKSVEAAVDTALTSMSYRLPTTSAKP